ncbi:Ubiquitin-related modifier 1 [Ceratocystis pirilliformis]|uniref:Ubiquitin-related modifier 1 n=1 Tax=Ceratocystis pirilliformis TaxID=259994 RepID=A0ABR3YVK2_9PEZI
MSAITETMGPRVVTIKVELAGGLDILFDGKPQLKVAIAASSVNDDGAPSIRMSELITHLGEEVMTDSRKDLFVLDGSIRPGIMVLINEVDWELEGEEECVLVSGDEVLFVSTLHGG